MKHKGMSQHRFAQNPLEKKFAEAWNKQNTLNRIGSNLLDYMLAENPNDPRGEVTDRDMVVAATVVQWLGSPVGQGFLNDVLRGHIKKNVIQGR